MKQLIITLAFISLMVAGCSKDQNISKVKPIDNTKKHLALEGQNSGWQDHPSKPHKKMGNMAMNNSAHNRNKTENSLKVKAGEIKAIPGGKKIAEIYDSKSTLNGKKIKVTGKVVKFSPNIMKRNWIHIHDGTSSNNNFDLTITTSTKVKVGDIIVAEGIATYDKDFGAGYFYKVILEKSKVTIKQ